MNKYYKTISYCIALCFTIITISKAEIFTVTNNSSSGTGSLMQAVADANNTVGADTIIFANNVRGTIDNNGPITPDESLTIIGPGPDLLTITSGGSGRVIFIDASSGNSFTFTGLTISGGYISSGAGAGVFARGGELIIKNCIIKDNVDSYPNSGGGGIYATIINVYIENSLIENNTSHLSGAGMSLAASSITVVKNSSIVNNTVGSSIPDWGGGGIYVSGILTLDNCTISGNSHPTRGGAIDVYGFVNLNSCTVADNSADDCGGIYEHSPSSEDTIVVLANSIIAGNTSSTSSKDLYGKIYSNGYNLILDQTGATITGDVTGNIYDQDPLLSPIQNYSPTVMFHSLQTGSPAIDNANNQTSLSTDQRGIYRPQDGDENGNAVADIGSIELFNDVDDDGISDLEEQGPNGNDPNYDGNNDGFADKDQSNVTSFWNYNDEFYLTIAAPVGYKLIDVKAIDNPSPGNNPNVEFPVGFFTFIIDLQGNSNPVVVRMYLPQGAVITDYYKYGQTPILPLPHWYQFMYDNQTGAEIIQPNIVDLHFIDGERGDNDVTVNGYIIEPGGPVGSISAVEGEEGFPFSFKLEQNYPNPFNPSTKINFSIPERTIVTLKIYDILGNEVAVLVNEEKSAGEYEIQFDGFRLSTGIYFYQLKTGSFVQTKKMSLIK